MKMSDNVNNQTNFPKVKSLWPQGKCTWEVMPIYTIIIFCSQLGWTSLNLGILGAFFFYGKTNKPHQVLSRKAVRQGQCVILWFSSWRTWKIPEERMIWPLPEQHWRNAVKCFCQHQRWLSVGTGQHSVFSVNHSFAIITETFVICDPYLFRHMFDTQKLLGPKLIVIMWWSRWQRQSMLFLGLCRELVTTLTPCRVLGPWLLLWMTLTWVSYALSCAS